MLLARKPITDVSPACLERTQGQGGPPSVPRWHVCIWGEEDVAFVVVLSLHACLNACDSIFLRTEIQRLSSGHSRFAFLKIGSGLRPAPTLPARACKSSRDLERLSQLVPQAALAASLHLSLTHGAAPRPFRGFFPDSLLKMLCQGQAPLTLGIREDATAALRTSQLSHLVG